MRASLLLAATALIASPTVFAQDQNACEEHVKELENAKTEQLREPAKGQVENHIKQARQAHEAGRNEDCIVHATKALQKLRAPGPEHSSERENQQ